MDRRVLQSRTIAVVVAVACCSNAGVPGARPGAAVSAADVGEGVTGMPADITSLLSIAGVWQPIVSQFIDQNRASNNAGAIANTFAGNIKLANGKEGLVATGWSYSGFSNTATSITPVTMAMLEQQEDGTLRLATSQYVSDPQTNGGGNVLVTDFNNDAIQDFFLPAHNESPNLPASSTAYLSTRVGTYDKVTVDDSVQAHGATVTSINGTPTVFTSSYYVANNHADTVTQYSRNGFVVVPDIGTGGHSSIAVADFYGDGVYSVVCGDCKYGPGLPFDPTGRDYMGIDLWQLSRLSVSGRPFTVGIPYFNGKPQFAAYPSFVDPIKTHNARAWVDDFNHDNQTDIVVQGMIWGESTGQSKNILQMFQNKGHYEFADVTDSLNPQYDQNCNQFEFVPQVRDIDGSGINSYLLGSYGNGAKPSGNYVIVNDGTGNLRVALHETLNTYGQQIAKWLAASPTLAASQYFISPDLKPAIRAYQTADDRLNFVAIAQVTKRVNASLPLWVTQYVFVNLPLRLDLSKQLTRPIAVSNRNGSHRIRTFAGDDTIRSGNDGGFATIDGGLGTNTVVYSGPSPNYVISRNADGSWTVKDRVGGDGTDTLIHVQRLQFTDTTVMLDSIDPHAPTGLTGTVNGSTVTLRWQSPGSGPAPTSYVLEAGSRSGTADLAVSDTGSAATTLTASNVGAGTYFVRVRAKTADVTSAPSNEIVVAVGGACAGAPGPASGLTAAVNGGTVTLQWQAPTGGCIPTSYVIEAGSTSGSRDLAVVATGSALTVFSATGVGAGTYYVRVRSVNTAGTSEPSSEVRLLVGSSMTAFGGLRWPR